MPLEKWYSLKDFCSLYNLSPDVVRRMLREKTLRGFTTGKVWHISSCFENELTTRFEGHAIDDLPLLRLAEVQDILEVSSARARALASRGKLHCTMVGKMRRFSVNDLRKYLLQRGKFRAHAAHKQRSRELAYWARKRLDIDGPEPEIEYSAESMEELRAIIETIGNISSEVRRAQCFNHLFQHFKETGRYIGMKPIPKAARPEIGPSSSHSPKEELESLSLATGSSSAASPEPNR